MLQLVNFKVESLLLRLTLYFKINPKTKKYFTEFVNDAKIQLLTNRYFLG